MTRYKIKSDCQCHNCIYCKDARGWGYRFFVCTKMDDKEINEFIETPEWCPGYVEFDFQNQ